MSPRLASVTYAIVFWMIVNAVFMTLEVTIFNDATDLNNSILLVLWILSIIGLLSMKKVGGALALFTLIYAFSFNAFNVIYFSEARVLNGASIIINAAAIVYMFTSIFQNRYK
jgi:hypothetical protein